MTIELANRLVELRKEKGYSQEELSDKLGVSRQAVSKWERGESSPDTDNLIELAKIYGISLDELIGSDPAPKEEMVPEEVPSSKGFTLISTIVTSVYSVLALVVYVLLGVFLTEDSVGWRVGWVLFLLIPVVSSIFVSLEKRKASLFLYPVLVTGIYCLCSLLTGLWHPLWVLFLSIPVYYAITEGVEKATNKK